MHHILTWRKTSKLRQIYNGTMIHQLLDKVNLLPIAKTLYFIITVVSSGKSNQLIIAANHYLKESNSLHSIEHALQKKSLLTWDSLLITRSFHSHKKRWCPQCFQIHSYWEQVMSAQVLLTMNPFTHYQPDKVKELALNRELYANVRFTNRGRSIWQRRLVLYLK